jgi:cytochrome P450
MDRAMVQAGVIADAAIRPNLSDPDLVPFEPPARPMVGLPALRAMRRNYIETFPRSTYERKSTRVTTLLSDVLFICDPELIQDMLVGRADSFGRDGMTRRAFTPIIGERSLFLAEGADWRWQRRAAAPTFRHEALLSFVPIFAEVAARQVARWSAAPGAVPVDVAAAMTRVTFDVIVETMLGGSAALDVEAFGHAVTTTFETAPWHTLLALFSLPRWTPFPGRRRAMRARDYLHREMRRMVAARRSKPSVRPDLLDLLLAARDAETGRDMTDTELVPNLLTFIIAGHETTAVALTWALWLLAKDDAVQQRLCAEAHAVAGEAAIEPVHVERLTQCRQVIQEAMRLYPPAPAVVRQPKADTTLGEHRVKPSTQIIVPTFALHRHVGLWDNPTTFDPDRFAPDRTQARPRYAYLPFGTGPRICIGASFAMIEAPVVLATLVRAFRFRALPKQRPMPVARVSLRPAGGMPLFIELR